MLYPLCFSWLLAVAIVLHKSENGCTFCDTVFFPLYRASSESLTRTVVYDTVCSGDSDPVYETVNVVQRVVTGPETRENVAYGVTDRVCPTPNPAYAVVNTRP